MIAEVILWQNGMVMVFDEDGEQMDRYQGPALEALPRALEEAPPTVRWQKGIWGVSTEPATRDDMLEALHTAAAL